MLKKIFYKCFGILLLLLFSGMNLFLGYKNNWIFIFPIIIAINCLFAYGLVSLMILPEKIKTRHRKYIFLAVALLGIMLSLFYYMGYSYVHCLEYVSGTLILILLVCFISFILLADSKKPHKWVCIILQLLLLLLFCWTFGIFRNLFVSSLVSIPLIVVFSTFDEIRN